MPQRVGDTDMAPKTVSHGGPAPVTIQTGLSLSPLPLGRLPIASALRRAFAKGYGRADLARTSWRAWSSASWRCRSRWRSRSRVGAPPQHGLYTAIVAGALVALLGGCKFQVTGPTAAFIVILAPIVTKHGLAGLLTAGLMAGVHARRDGRRAARPPHPVHPAPGHDRLHDRHRHGHRHAPDQGRLRPRHRAAARALHRTSSRPCGRRAARHEPPSSCVAARHVRALCSCIPRFIKKVPAPLIAITLRLGRGALCSTGVDPASRSPRSAAAFTRR